MPSLARRVFLARHTPALLALAAICGLGAGVLLMSMSSDVREAAAAGAEMRASVVPCDEDYVAAHMWAQR